MIGVAEHRPYIGQRVFAGSPPQRAATVLRVAPHARVVIQYDDSDTPVKVFEN